MMFNWCLCYLMFDFLPSEDQINTKEHQIDKKLIHMNTLIYLYVSTSCQFGVKLMSNW